MPTKKSGRLHDCQQSRRGWINFFIVAMFVQDDVGRVWAVYYNNNLQYLLAIMIHRVIGKTYHGKVVGRYIMLLGFTFF